MRLDRGLRQALREEAARALPFEACGLLGGRGAELLCFIPCRNAAQSAYRYAIAPEDVMRALREFERDGMELRAIFHSHPAGEPRPSARDIREAMYPGVLHLIAGAPPAMALHGYWLGEGEVREEPLVSED